jgi:hypothetical protein
MPGKLAGACFGEIRPIRRTQPARLPVYIRPAHRVIAGLIDEAVPYFDEFSAGFFCPRLIDVIEDLDICIAYVAHRRQTDPEDRHPFGLEGGPDFADARAVERGPFVPSGTENPAAPLELTYS